MIPFAKWSPAFSRASFKQFSCFYFELSLTPSAMFIYCFFFLIDCVDYLGSFFKRLRENARDAETIPVVGSHFLPGLTF